MAIIKNIKGNLLDVEVLIKPTVTYFYKTIGIQLEENEYVTMATSTAYFFAKNDLIPKFSPFDRSLKKIYGNDFFDEIVVRKKMKRLPRKLFQVMPQITRYPYVNTSIDKFIKEGMKVMNVNGEKVDIADKPIYTTSAIKALDADYDGVSTMEKDFALATAVANYIGPDYIKTNHGWEEVW